MLVLVLLLLQLVAACHNARAILRYLLHQTAFFLLNFFSSVAESSAELDDRAVPCSWLLSRCGG